MPAGREGRRPLRQVRRAVRGRGGPRRGSVPALGGRGAPGAVSPLRRPGGALFCPAGPGAAGRCGAVPAAAGLSAAGAAVSRAGPRVPWQRGLRPGARPFPAAAPAGRWRVITGARAPGCSWPRLPSPARRGGLAVWVLLSDCAGRSCWCVESGCDTRVLSLSLYSPQGPGSEAASWHQKCLSDVDLPQWVMSPDGRNPRLGSRRPACLQS